MVTHRFDVFLAQFDPAQGSEMKKTRPCVVISPDEMNRNLRTVIVAPMTTQGRSYPSRVSFRFKGKPGSIALDQIRAVSHVRLIKRLGRIDIATGDQVLAALREMFEV